MTPSSEATRSVKPPRPTRLDHALFERPVPIPAVSRGRPGCFPQPQPRRSALVMPDLIRHPKVGSLFDNLRKT